LIEIYTQKIGFIYFAIAISQQKIVTSTFSIIQKTAIHIILSNLPFNMPFQFFDNPSAQAKTALLALKDIYDGKDGNINLPLATSDLPAYTRKVLNATASIPIGYVTSYGAIAKAVGGGARAVGNAMARNLFAPIVPCHRVVKSDLGLGGYGAGGLQVKLEFLSREKRGFVSPRTVEVNRAQLEVFPVEFVLRKYA
jgi:O-6-methylguanine DNA methyltransferase